MNKYQYEGKQLGFWSTVDAIYVETDVPSLNSNPFITALPSPGTDYKEIHENYSVPISFDQSESMSSNSKIHQLAELLKLRIELPFQSELEEAFIEVLRNSYSERQMVPVCENENMVSKCLANPAEGTNSGFVLFGCSGSGKSSSIKSMLDHYPQVIVHRNIPNVARFQQIVFLFVTCVTNSNFDALYQAIGQAVDRALRVDIYEKMVKQARTLGAKQKVVENLIETFAVGAIIFDEIQLINFASTKENSFEALMTIANNTKVAICAVGTEDTYEKMFSKTRNARRMLIKIKADDYCGDIEYFTYVMKTLYKYQLFDEPQALSTELIKTFFHETGGVIFLAVLLYSRVMQEYLKQKECRSITPGFVRHVSNKYFGSLKQLVNYGLSEGSKAEMVTNLIDDLKKDEDAMKQKAFKEEILANQAQSIRNEMISQAVMKVYELYEDDYSQEQIREAADQLLQKKDYNDSKSLARDTVKKLQKKKHNPNKKNSSLMDYAIE